MRSPHLPVGEKLEVARNIADRTFSSANRTRTWGALILHRGNAGSWQQDMPTELSPLPIGQEHEESSSHSRRKAGSCRKILPTAELSLLPIGEEHEEYSSSIGKNPRKLPKDIADRTFSIADRTVTWGALISHREKTWKLKKLAQTIGYTKTLGTGGPSPDMAESLLWNRPQPSFLLTAKNGKKTELFFFVFIKIHVATLMKPGVLTNWKQG
jgi:hypothetical protein